MLSTFALILLSQTQPAVRRSTPLADDPGMVTRNIPSGTQNVNVVGGGPLVPGSPDGGLIGTVIAIGPDGGAVPVQGSISATNPSVGTLGSSAPTSGTQVSGPDSAGLLRAPWVLTTTPDAGDPALLVRVVGGTSGGGGGGSVTQGTVPWLVAGADAGAVPVQGTVNAAQSGTWTVRNQDGVGNNLASSTSAPAGAEQALIVRNIPSGTQTVTGAVTASGTVTANQGTPGTTANRWPIQVTDGTNLATVTVAGALRTDSSATTQPVSGTVTANAGTNLNTSALALETTLGARLADSTFTGRINTLGQKTMAASTPVVVASDQSRISTGIAKAASAPATSSVSCATSATVLTPSPLASRTSLCVTNNGANTVFIGAAGVTTVNGFPLLPGASFCDDVGTQAYSCIVAAGTENVRVLEN
jgi:hypothetical protein